MTIRMTILATPALLLAACGGSSGEEQEGAASGEVLEGTISDGMLPLDTVTSQPPLEKPSPTTGGTAAASEAASEEAEEAESGASEAAAPTGEAATPAE